MIMSRRYAEFTIACLLVLAAFPCWVNLDHIDVSVKYFLMLREQKKKVNENHVSYLKRERAMQL